MTLQIVKDIEQDGCLAEMRSLIQAEDAEHRRLCNELDDVLGRDVLAK